MAETLKPGSTKAGEKGVVALDVVDISDGEKQQQEDKCRGSLERECRVCHMSIEDDKNQDIELGCSCKADLAIAHKQCADTWFRIKGNRTCEICGSVASNVHIEGEDGEVPQQPNEGNVEGNATTGGNVVAETVNEQTGRRNGQRLVNFLLASIVFAFVISWVCRFSIPSS